MYPLLAFSLLVGLLCFSPRHSRAEELDFPPEPAVTPTLEMAAKATTQSPKESKQQNEETGVSREAEVMEETPQNLPLLPTAVLVTEQELENFHPMLRGKARENGDAEDDEFSAGFYGLEGVTK